MLGVVQDVADLSEALEALCTKLVQHASYAVSSAVLDVQRLQETINRAATLETMANVGEILGQSLNANPL